jgi:hypothetical protein
MLRHSLDRCSTLVQHVLNKCPKKTIFFVASTLFSGNGLNINLNLGVHGLIFTESKNSTREDREVQL